MTTAHSTPVGRRSDWLIALGSVLGSALLLELIIRIYSGRLIASPTFGPVRLGREPAEALLFTVMAAIMSLALARFRMSDQEAERLTFYQLAVGAVGVGILVWIQASRHGVATPFEYAATAALLGLLCLYGIVSNSISTWNALKGVPRDMTTLARQPVVWLALCLSAAVLAWSPTPEWESIQHGPAFEAWYARQKRVTLPAGQDDGRIQVVEFIDYECPFSRIAETRYQHLLYDLRTTLATSVNFERYDFPLSTDCNTTKNLRNLHSAACEAAAAVRMGRASGREAEVEAWLWDNQKNLSRQTIFAMLQGIGRVQSPEADYPAVIAEVSKQASIGASLGVHATPTFMVNGVLVNDVSEGSLRWAVSHEVALRRLPHSAD